MIFSTGRDSSNGGSKVLRINRSFIQNLITIKLINYFNLNLCLTTIKKNRERNSISENTSRYSIRRKIRN